LDKLPPVADMDRKHIKRLIERLKVYNEQIEEIEDELEKLAHEHYSYLLTYPGCGIVTASKFVAFIKDIKRFQNEKRLARYSGIAPRKNESGKTKRNVSSTRGHSALRRAFKTVALSQIGRRGNQRAKEYFRKKIKEGKTKKEALKCLMRQNVKIVFRIMKEQRPYY
jgi:transposase